jgi:choline dehydrogenase-like flavoprotein
LHWRISYKYDSFLCYILLGKTHNLLVKLMKIAVVGAGIVGVTTAYELAQDGHQVTVFEQRGAAAEQASFANAGVLAPGYVTPWASPGMPWKVAKQLFAQHAAVRVGLFGAPRCPAKTGLLQPRTLARHYRQTPA